MRQALTTRKFRHLMSIAAAVWSRRRRYLGLSPDAIHFYSRQTGYRVVRLGDTGEADCTKRWYAAIAPGDSVADVGANHGHYALFAAKKLNGNGKVFAFEPYGQNVEFIYKNAAANGFRCITIVHAGLSDAIGVEPLYLSPKWLGLAHFRDKPGGGNPNTSATVTVGWTLTLEAYFGALGAIPNIIKIDVDGDELRVLRGGESILRGSGARLFLENHLVYADHQEEVLDLLSSYGFVVEVDQPASDGHRHVIGVFK